MTDHRDVRLRGFADRASLRTAWQWLDAVTIPLEPEWLDPALARGRVLAQDIIGPAGLPGAARAAVDGYAVRAADCEGANAYNPLPLTWCEPGAAQLPPGAACPVATGWTLPVGADAVLGFEAAERADVRTLEVSAPVAVGAGVDRHDLSADMLSLPRGTRLLSQHAACLAAWGVTAVPVLPRPLVHLVVPGPKTGADVLTPMLVALLARDGALAEAIPLTDAGEPELAAALRHTGLVLLAGRSGTGPDDGAAAAIRAAGGDLALHGLAIRPGGSAGLGTITDAPVILLPGEPFACLAAYDMLAARLVRRLSGLAPSLPYPVIGLELARKIVSGIGLTDIVPVRVTHNRAQPVSAESGLTAMLADGFVVVPEASEGYSAGAIAGVHLYEASEHGSGLP